MMRVENRRVLALLARANYHAALLRHLRPWLRDSMV
jgi:hypothetical protein